MNIAYFVTKHYWWFGSINQGLGALKTILRAAEIKDGIISGEIKENSNISVKKIIPTGENQYCRTKFL